VLPEGAYSLWYAGLQPLSVLDHSNGFAVECAAPLLGESIFLVIDDRHLPKTSKVNLVGDREALEKLMVFEWFRSTGTRVQLRKRECSRPTG
jgi:hypothetical protein